MAKQVRVWTGTQWDTLATQLPDMSNYAYLPTTPVSGFRNKIINGAFDIWQRGTSFTTNGVYTADRWVMGFGGTGTAMTTSQVTLTAGNPIPNYEPQYALRCAVTGGSGTSSLVVLTQKIEDVRTFAGQTITLSFWAKASSGTPGLGFDFYQEFGSGGSATIGGIGATKWTLSTTWTRYSVTVNIPSISGKTIGTGSLFASRFWFSSGSDYNSLNNSLGIQSPTIDIWGVQVEAGSVATPFEQRPIGTELALCQRYYQRFNAGGIYTYLANGTAHDSGQIFAVQPLVVQMRTSPTSLDTAALSNYFVENSAGVFASGLTNIVLQSNVTSPNVLGLQITKSASFTTGAFYKLISNATTAAYLGASAEL